MNFNKVVVRGLVATVAVFTMAGSFAQGTNTVRMIVPFSPGGVTDQTARLLAESMARELKQTIIIENRPGGGSRIGVEAAMRSAPDGKTLLFTNSSYAILPVVDSKVKFDPLKSMMPLSLTATYGLGIVSGKHVPVKTLAELTQYGKKNPGKLTYGSAGPGSGAHFAGEYLQSVTGIEMMHVPYKSTTAALNDVVGGVIDLAFDASAKPYVDGGRVTLLSVTGAKRDPRFPGTPTAAEAGLPQFVLTSWVGLFAPTGMDPALAERVSKAANNALADPIMKKRLQDAGLSPQGGNAAQLMSAIQSELVLYRKIAKDAKLKFD